MRSLEDLSSKPLLEQILTENFLPTKQTTGKVAQLVAKAVLCNPNLSFENVNFWRNTASWAQTNMGCFPEAES